MPAGCPVSRHKPDPRPGCVTSREDALPADGSEQSGARLIVEGDDDTGGGKIHAVDQQRTSGKQRQMVSKTFESKTEEPRATGIN